MQENEPLLTTSISSARVNLVKVLCRCMPTPEWNSDHCASVTAIGISKQSKILATGMAIFVKTLGNWQYMNGVKDNYIIRKIYMYRLFIHIYFW